MVLVRYIEALREWNADNVQNDGIGSVLSVFSQHKAHFGELLALFESDELLLQTQELSVVGKSWEFRSGSSSDYARFGADGPDVSRGCGAQAFLEERSS